MARSPLAASPTWPQTFVDDYRAKGYWQDETFAEFLSVRAERFGPRLAAVGRSARTGEPVRLTYAELDDAAAAVAAHLAGLGLQAGDRVVLQLPNVIEYLTFLFGVFRLGALPVFALPAHREVELTQFCAVSDAAAHIVAGTGQGHDYLALAGNVAARLRESGVEPPLVVDVEQIGIEQIDLTAAGRRAPQAGSSAGEIAFLQLSGGTTGVSKLIPRTHADYLYSVRASAEICDVTPDTVMLVTLPAAHNFAMSSPGLLGVLHAGGTVVLAPDPSPATALALIESERVTMTALVPPLLLAWLPTAKRGRHDLSSLEVVQVGGAKLPDSVAPRVPTDLGARLQQVFGMAEGLVNYTRRDDSPELVGTTQGRPISPDDEIRVVDERDADVPPGEEGMLLTRGPYTIRGYYRADEHNADAFTPDGFYRTGDLVRQLPSGHLIVTGRAKEQINRGGDKIAVAEVEDHLLTHPAVHDAAVIPIPDQYLGERSCAFILSAHPPAADQLREHLRAAGLAAYKIPDRFEFVDHFPTSPVGKISRRDLRTALAASLAAPSPTA